MALAAAGTSDLLLLSAPAIPPWLLLLLQLVLLLLKLLLLLQLLLVLVLSLQPISLVVLRPVLMADTS
jgi:hypothetical protein